MRSPAELVFRLSAPSPAGSPLSASRKDKFGPSSGCNGRLGSETVRDIPYGSDAFSCQLDILVFNHAVFPLISGL